MHGPVTWGAGPCSNHPWLYLFPEGLRSSSWVVGVSPFDVVKLTGTLRFMKSPVDGERPFVETRCLCAWIYDAVARHVWRMCGNGRGCGLEGCDEKRRTGHLGCRSDAQTIRGCIFSLRGFVLRRGSSGFPPFDDVKLTGTLRFMKSSVDGGRRFIETAVHRSVAGAVQRRLDTLASRRRISM